MSGQHLKTLANASICRLNKECGTLRNCVGFKAAIKQARCQLSIDLLVAGNACRLGIFRKRRRTTFAGPVTPFQSDVSVPLLRQPPDPARSRASRRVRGAMVLARYGACH